jgi:phosphoadenosine phosphosulfate reductase
MMDLRQAQERVGSLTRRYGALDGEAFLRPLIEEEFPGGIALLSSFGAESALLLHMVASVRRDIPVLFLDTGKLFPETLAYRDRLVGRLGLTDLRVITPAADRLSETDPAGTLWQHDPEACCALRKVEPLRSAAIGFTALISGRKRYHGALRAFLPRIEAVDGIVKIDPIATWLHDRVEREFTERALPPHPLAEEGYLSIGCAPCTERVRAGEDLRAGRWSGIEKTECGIHNGRRIAPTETNLAEVVP